MSARKISRRQHLPLGLVSLCALLWGCGVHLEYADPEATPKDIRDINDQAVLTRAAIDGGNAAVRQAALEKLSDQDGLARAACKSMDRDIRRAAVEKLTAPTALAIVALNSWDPALRQSAIARLSDEPMLAKVALESPDARDRRAAVMKLSDQPLLAAISLNDKNSSVHLACIDRINVNLQNDQRILAMIAVESNDPLARQAAVARLDIAQQRAPAVLARIAVDSQDTQTRATAVARLSDQDALCLVAMESDDPAVGGATVSKLLYQQQLAPVAISGRNGEVRQAAVSRMVAEPWRINSDILAKVAVDARDKSIRQKAMANLAFNYSTDQSVYIAVALEVEKSVTRYAAVAQLTSQNVLARVTLEDADGYVRQAAVSRLTDQELLVRVVAESRESEVRLAAAAKLGDQTLLASLATQDPDWRIRRAAVMKLVDPTLLASIMSREKEWGVLRAAITILGVDRLTDQAALARVAAEAENIQTRQRALAKLRIDTLTDEALLTRIVAEAPDLSLRRAAILKLNLDTLQNQAALAMVAIDSANANLRLAALSKITSSAWLRKVILEASDGKVRSAAEERLNAQSAASLRQLQKYLQQASANLKTMKDPGTRGSIRAEIMALQISMGDPNAAKAALAEIADDRGAQAQFFVLVTANHLAAGDFGPLEGFEKFAAGIPPLFPNGVPGFSIFGDNSRADDPDVEKAAQLAKTGNFNAALETAKSISNDNDRDKACEIIGIAQLAAGDIQGASRTAAQMRTTPYRNSSTLYGLIAAAHGKKGDYPSALASTRNMVVSWDQSQQFARLAQAIARSGDSAGSANAFQEAIDAADRVPPDYSSDMASPYVYIFLSQMQVADQYGAAATLRHARYVVEDAIASIHSKPVFGEQWNESTGPLMSRYASLIRIQGLSGDLEAARASIHLMAALHVSPNSIPPRVQAAAGDPAAALDAALKIRDINTRSDSIHAIVEQCLEGGLVAQAISAAAKSESPYYRQLDFATIARAQAQAGAFETLDLWVATFHDPDECAMLLLGAAQGAKDSLEK